MLRRPTTWLAAIAAIVVVLAVREISGRVMPALQPTAEVPVSRAPQVFAADPALGTSLAPVTVILFSDFECPYCAQVAPILRAAVTKYGGQLRLVWKDAPSPQHNQALMAAESAQCAGAQGKFWQYHDQLFASQPSLGEELYITLASSLGLDLVKFSVCRRQHEPYPIIGRNRDEAAVSGVDETPYLFVNNRRWGGAFTSEEFDLFMQQAQASLP